jgi:hypothetical protein
MPQSWVWRCPKKTEGDRVNYVKEAPVNLIYTCDYAKMVDKTSDEAKTLFSGFHAGVIAQNIYLYCASEGLATIVRAYIDITSPRKSVETTARSENHLGTVGGISKKDIVEDGNQQSGLLIAAHSVFLIMHVSTRNR